MLRIFVTTVAQITVYLLNVFEETELQKIQKTAWLLMSPELV